MTDAGGLLSLVVDDYDEAIGFYERALGFEVTHDEETDDGTRIVQLRPPSREGMGFWLFEAETEAQRARVGDQTGGPPCGVLYTSDFRTAHERLRESDATVRGEPVETESHVSVHLEDPYGNTFVLVELTEAPSASRR